MTDYKVFHASSFEEADPTLYNWTLDFHFCDGGVDCTKIDQVSIDQIVDACKASLRYDNNIDRVFLWCDGRWYGEIYR